MKKCSDCKKRFPESKFYRGQHRCKLCSNIRTYEWRLKNPEKVREISRKSGRKRKEYRNAYSKKYYLANSDDLKARQIARYRKIKDLAYKAYGGYKCACCGEIEKSFLSLDHMNNDGYEHRKTVQAPGLTLWLRKNNYPIGFQVLCMNCQFGRKHNAGVCPHKKVRESR